MRSLLGPEEATAWYLISFAVQISAAGEGGIALSFSSKLGIAISRLVNVL